MSNNAERKYEGIESYIYDEVLRYVDDLLDIAVDRLEKEDIDTKQRIWNYIEVDIKQKIIEKKEK